MHSQYRKRCSCAWLQCLQNLRRASRCQRKYVAYTSDFCLKKGVWHTWKKVVRKTVIMCQEFCLFLWLRCFYKRRFFLPFLAFPAPHPMPWQARLKVASKCKSAKIPQVWAVFEWILWVFSEGRIWRRGSEKNKRYIPRVFSGFGKRKKGWFLNWLCWLK